MTTILKYDGIGLSAGTALGNGVAGTGDTPVDDFAGPDENRIFKITDDPEFPDAFEMTPTVVGSGSNSTAVWTFPAAVPQYALRYYFKKTLNISGAAFHMACAWEAPTYAHRYSLSGSGAPGQFRFYEYGGTQKRSSSNTMALDTWYRCEALINGTTDEYSIRYFEGHSLSPLLELTHDAGANVGSLYDAFRIGHVGNVPSSPGGIRYAHLEVTDDASTFIGPYETSTPEPTPTPWRVKKANGSIVPLTMRGVWDGTAVVPVTYRATT